MAKGPKRPPVGGGASRNRPTSSPGRIEGAKSPDATGMLNFVPIDADDGGGEDEASATQFFAIPKPPQSNSGPKATLGASNPNFNAPPPPPAGGFAPPPTGGFAPPPPPPPTGGIGQGQGVGIGAGGIGQGAGIGAGRGAPVNQTPFHQVQQGTVPQGGPQNGQVGTQRVYVILGVVMFLILLIVAITVYMAMGKDDKPVVEEKETTQKRYSEPSDDEEEFEEPADEPSPKTRTKRKTRRKTKTVVRTKKTQTFKGGSMKVKVSGGDGGSINLSGCGRGRSASGTFSNVKAGAKCKVTIQGVSATFTAKKTVTCKFSGGGARLSCK